MSRKKLNIDYWLVLSVLGLLLAGIVILASVSAVFSLEKFNKTGYFFLHQMLYGFLPGIVLGTIAFFIPLNFLKKWSFAFIIIALFLMALVLVPGLGISSGGAPRWLKIGAFSFQPSEMLKVAFIIYLSSWLANRTSAKKGKDWKMTLVPFFFILGLVFFLFYFQSNASTLGLIMIIASVLYFLSNTPFWHMIVLLLIGGLMSALMIIFTPYRIKRILVVLNLLKDPMGAGYQIKQSLITIGSGGILGSGLGMSQQKFGKFLPETMSDSIFAIFAEEVGLVGCVVLISLFLIFFWRCVKIARNSRDKFCQLFSFGIGVWICVQAFINIGAMIQIFPLTGIPLPFISYGGSHIIAELIGVGILLNISKHSQS